MDRKGFREHRVYLRDLLLEYRGHYWAALPYDPRAPQAWVCALEGNEIVVRRFEPRGVAEYARYDINANKVSYRG